MTRKTRSSCLIGGLLIALTTFAMQTPANATQTINLTVVSGYPPVAAWVKVFKDYYVPEVAKRLAKTGNYKINWNEGFSGTIAKPAGVG